MARARSFSRFFKDSIKKATDNIKIAGNPIYAQPEFKPVPTDTPSGSNAGLKAFGVAVTTVAIATADAMLQKNQPEDQPTHFRKPK